MPRTIQIRDGRLLFVTARKKNILELCYTYSCPLGGGLDTVAVSCPLPICRLAEVGNAIYNVVHYCVMQQCSYAI